MESSKEPLPLTMLRAAMSQIEEAFATAKQATEMEIDKECFVAFLAWVEQQMEDLSDHMKEKRGVTMKDVNCFLLHTFEQIKLH